MLYISHTLYLHSHSIIVRGQLLTEVNVSALRNMREAFEVSLTVCIWMQLEASSGCPRVLSRQSNLEQYLRSKGEEDALSEDVRMYVHDGSYSQRL
jgi:hypothetical protein